METASQLSGAPKTARPAPDRLLALVVDPSPDRRRMARLSLALAGYRVDEAVDSTSALAALRSRTPSVIVTGVSMAGPCDGLGLCELVHACIPERDCAVVVLTGRTDPDRLRRIEEAGANAVLRQPFSPPELIAAVHGARKGGRAAPAGSRGPIGGLRAAAATGTTPA